MKLNYLATLVVLLLGCLTNAQTYKGKVLDKQSQKPLDGARISSHNETVAYSNAQGNFELKQTQEDSKIKISYVGYKALEVTMNSSANTMVFYLEEEPIQIDGVLVTGNPKIDPVLTLVSNDYAKTIVQPRNVADLFKDINGFSLIKRGNYAIDPSFRSSQYEQLNIQFNGGTKAMHACPNRMDPVTTHVIPEEIEKIEIIKGPYTVRYGATFGGIINMVTQKPEPEDYGIRGTVNAGYESNGNSLVSMARLQKATEKFDLAGNFGYRDFGNYKDGDGVAVPSSFRSLDYGLRAGYNLSKNERIQAHWRQSYGRDVLHAGLAMDTDEDNSSIFSLDYKVTGLKGLVKDINAKAYYSYVDHTMSNTNRPSFMMVDALSMIDATTAGGKVELKLKPTHKSISYIGLDLLHIARDGDRTRLVKRNMMGPLPTPMTFVDKVWQDSYSSDYGVFLENKYSINEKTMLNAGVRYDMVISNSKDPELDFQNLYPNLGKRSEHNVSATASLKYAMSNKFLMELAFGRGVRSANMIERVINHFTVGQDAYEYIGNPNLDAEVNNQFEIGFKGNMPLSDKNTDGFTYASSFYYSYYKNYIVAVIDETLTRKFMPTQPPVNPKVFQNLDKAYKTGFEISAGIDFWSHFNFTTEVAYVYAKNKDLNESLPLVPPLTTQLKLGFEKERFWVNANYRLTAKQDNIALSFGEQSTPGYDVLDLRLGCIPIKNITLGLAALNIFDKTYNNHLNFSFNNQSNFDRVPINDPGRNLSVFAQYKF